MPEFESEDIFNRTRLLVGSAKLEKFHTTRVILFGVGGVGSWCAESLVRSGIGCITLVDSDTVNVTNINRQLMATTKTVGLAKVDVLRERLLEINPHAEVNAIRDIYQESNSDSFSLEKYDIIIDAIDSLECKMQLLLHACKTRAKVYSSMGAALKMDPTRIQVAEFWKVKGCPLARALRDKFKKKNLRPGKKIRCVYSDELLKNLGAESTGENPTGESATGESATGNTLGASPAEFRKVATNGTMAHATAIFGFTLAGLVMKDLFDQPEA